MTTLDLCPDCDGSGEDPGRQWHCRTCFGSGFVVNEWRDCGTCEGEGCEVCEWQGGWWIDEAPKRPEHQPTGESP